MNKSYRDRQGNSDRLLTNHSIYGNKVLCIEHNNNNLGIISKQSALNLAQELNLDLVQIALGNNKIPTCKIIDAGKYKYELSKKKKENEKKQRESLVKFKEVKFRPTTDENDLKIKAKKTDEFLAENFKVKVGIDFKGRELSHQEVAMQTLQQFLSYCNLAEVDGSQTLENRKLSIFLYKKQA